jgi:Family of unknown function (DUF5808)
VKNIRRILSLVAIALLIASVVKELRLPSDERTWHGTVAGIFPYDLRIPTPGRLRATMWNPDDSRFLVPTVFGVGWSLNLAAIATAWAHS